MLVSAAALAILWFAAPAFAQTDLDRCRQLNEQFGGLFSWAVNSSYCTINGLIIRVINIVLGLSGAFAVLFIVIGGFRYITAGGSEETTEKARKTLTNSVIGLTIILLAAMIVRITANFITGNTGTGSSGTGNSSGTSGTNTGGNSGAGGSAGDNNSSGGSGSLSKGQAAQILAGADVSLPENNTVGYGKKLNIGVTLPNNADVTNALAVMCGSAGSAKMNVYFDSDLIATAPITLSTRQYLGTAAINQFIPKDNVTFGEIRVSICDINYVYMGPYALTITNS